MSKAAELAKIGDVANSGQLSGRRNIIYNGNLQCWQRSTNTTGLGAASGYFTADRWRVAINDASAGRFTMSRTAGDPDGFNYGLVINCTTADTSIAAGEVLIIQQKLEGQDLQHLKKGTSGAETITISFYAKIVGSATDFVVELVDLDNTRQISKIFTFTADWVRYYWTVPGDTSGALGQDANASLALHFWLHGGSTFTGGTLSTAWTSTTNANRAAGNDSIFASTDNEFYLAGIQMEIGSQATNFEHRSFGEELALCQRYYEIMWGGSSDYPNSLILYKANSTTEGMSILKFATPKRAGGTFAHTGTPVMYPGGDVTSVASDTFGILGGRARFTPTSNIVVNEAGHLDGGGSTAVADAEL
jgi:hypothetical protein